MPLSPPMAYGTGYTIVLRRPTTPIPRTRLSAASLAFFGAAIFGAAPSSTPKPNAGHPQTDAPKHASPQKRQDFDLQAPKTSAAGGSETRPPWSRSRRRFDLGSRGIRFLNAPPTQIRTWAMPRSKTAMSSATVENRQCRPRRRWGGRNPMSEGPGVPPPSEVAGLAEAQSP